MSTLTPDAQRMCSNRHDIFLLHNSQAALPVRLGVAQLQGAERGRFQELGARPSAKLERGAVHVCVGLPHSREHLTGSWPRIVSVGVRGGLLTWLSQNGGSSS